MLSCSSSAVGNTVHMYTQTDTETFVCCLLQQEKLQDKAAHFRKVADPEPSLPHLHWATVYTHTLRQIPIQLSVVFRSGRSSSAVVYTQTDTLYTCTLRQIHCTHVTQTDIETFACCLLQRQKQQDKAALAAMRELLAEEEQAQARTAAKAAKKDKQKAKKQQDQALSFAPPSSEPSETDTAAPADSGNACVTTYETNDEVAHGDAAESSDMQLLSHGTSVGVPIPAEQTQTSGKASLSDHHGRKKGTVSKQSTGFSAGPLEGRSDKFAQQSSMPAEGSKLAGPVPAEGSKPAGPMLAEGSKLAGSIPQRSRDSNDQAADLDASTTARQSADGADTISIKSSSANVGELPIGKMLPDEAHAWTSDEAELRVLLSCPLTKVPFCQQATACCIQKLLLFVALP